MSIAERISNTWKRDGFSGIALRSVVFSLRRIGGRATSCSEELDNRIAKRAVLRRYGSLLKRNELFRNRHSGKRCFVIGNGPSLNHQNLTPLANEITFVTNNFNRHPIVSKNWQPTYYCLSDPAFFDGREPRSSFEEILSVIPEAPFFVPHYAFDFLKETEIIPADRTYYIAPCEGIPATNSKTPDLTELAPGVQTVVQMAIMGALFMGCSPIYLLGLDHDWLSHGGNHLNFYSPDAAQKQPDGNLPGWSYHSMMDAVLTMWKVYELHQRIALATNIKIINCTRGGFLDVFERAQYESVVEDQLAPKSLPSAP